MGRQMNEWVTNASHYLQAAMIVMACVFVASLLWSGSDRTQPFRLLPHAPVTIKAGTEATIDVPVWRDLSRPCDAYYDRYLFDSSGARYDITTGGYASAEMIRSLTPGRMRFTFDAPVTLAPGPGSVVAPLRYYCNKGHKLLMWPIELTTVIPVTIER